MLRSCYVTKMKFPGAVPEDIYVRWFFVDDETESVPSTVYTSLNWEPIPRLAGEMPGVKRKWCDGSAPWLGAGELFGDEEAWLGYTDEDSPQIVAKEWICPPGEPEEIPVPLPDIIELFAITRSNWLNLENWLSYDSGSSRTRLIAHVVAFKPTDFPTTGEVVVSLNKFPFGSYVPVADTRSGDVRTVLFLIPKDEENPTDPLRLAFGVPGTEHVGPVVASAVIWRRFEINTGFYRHGAIEIVTSAGLTDEPSCGPLGTDVLVDALLAIVGSEGGGGGMGEWDDGFVPVTGPISYGGITLDVGWKVFLPRSGEGMSFTRRDEAEVHSGMILASFW